MAGCAVARMGLVTKISVRAWKMGPPTKSSKVLNCYISIVKEKKVGIEYQKAYKQGCKDGNKGQGSSLLLCHHYIQGYSKTIEVSGK